MIKHALFSIALLVAACDGIEDPDAADPTTETSEEQESALAIDPTVPIAADLNQGSQNSLGEVSGIVASTQYPGFVWMHRDGFAADRPSRERLYAMKVVDRDLVAFNGSSGVNPTREFTFASGIAMDNKNWEDIAYGKNVITNAGSSLYIGDIGNNPKKGFVGGARNSYQVYQIAEPNPAGSSAQVPSLQATWKFKYPASAQFGDGTWPNCETMFYLDRNLYIVTKEGDPRVYRLPTGFQDNPGATHTLVQVTNGATTRVVGPVSNPSFASFSADKTRFMIGAHERFFVYRVTPGTLTGDALVKAAILTPANPDQWDHFISNEDKLNAEGGTYESTGKGLLFATESKKVFHWPQANTEAP